MLTPTLRRDLHIAALVTGLVGVLIVLVGGQGYRMRHAPARDVKVSGVTLPDGTTGTETYTTQTAWGVTGTVVTRSGSKVTDAKGNVTRDTLSDTACFRQFRASEMSPPQTRHVWQCMFMTFGLQVVAVSIFGVLLWMTLFHMSPQARYGVRLATTASGAAAVALGVATLVMFKFWNDDTFGTTGPSTAGPGDASGVAGTVFVFVATVLSGLTLSR